jgi:hypothetical protein
MFPQPAQENQHVVRVAQVEVQGMYSPDSFGVSTLQGQWIMASAPRTNATRVSGSDRSARMAVDPSGAVLVLQVIDRARCPEAPVCPARGKKIAKKSRLGEKASQRPRNQGVGKSDKEFQGDG